MWFNIGNSNSSNLINLEVCCTLFNILVNVRHIVTVAKQGSWTSSLSELTVDLVYNMMTLLTELDPLALIDDKFSVALGNTTVDNGLSNQIGVLQVHTYWTVVSTSYRLIVGLS